MKLTAKQRKILEPYLQGEHPKENGEWDMRCPLHLDENRSASINVDKGLWICYMGCGRGSIKGLIAQKSNWVDPDDAGSSFSGGAGKHEPTRPANAPTSAHVAGWASALLSNKARLRDFQEARGLTVETIAEHEIGWDSSSEAYTIPVYGPDREIQNVRYYQLKPSNDRRKIWSVKDMGKPQLYPFRTTETMNGEVIVCEGELDSLITQQHGFDVLTRTASATTWDMSWNKHFRGKDVYLIHDADDTGMRANTKLVRALRGVARSVVPVRLPYKVVPKHGKDLTDFFVNDGYTADDLRGLMQEAAAKFAPALPEDLDPSDASIIETLDSAQVGKPQRIIATVRGKLEPGYSIPRAVELTCTMDRGETICSHCPLFGAGGKAKVEIAPDDPLCLGLIDASNKQITDAVREKFGALPCPRLQTATTDYQAVETLFVRPSVDHVRFSGSADFQSRKITSVGKHDTAPNTTVRITGSLQPDPRRQKNEFLAWIVEEQETSVDRFELSDEMAEKLRLFQPARGQSPLAKRVEVARELSREVTHIHQRDEMHVAFDLVWHSAVAFEFDGKPVDRGWVELLVVGDTRTGKSEAAKRLSEHYQAGEIVDCKAASFAGIVGGLQQFGGSGEWSVNWGVVPMNDRRMVTLDEAGGMTTEEIAQMSSVRSSGLAQITKIRADETSARTRLLWLANPRNSGMDSYLFGVDAIRPLIGNPEDIARFTLAMCVRTGEVPLDVINKSYQTGELRYTSELCHALVMWCWSRKRGDIEFSPGAVQKVYELATTTGTKYVEYPPLVQAANIRVKIAQMSVALAAATFSTDATHQKVLVKRRHVVDAVRFLDHVYAMPSFGYFERSQEAHRDANRAKRSVKAANRMLNANPGLRGFLRTSAQFKRQDIEEVLNYTREGANGVINQLHEMRMIKKQSGFVVVSPVLHDILRLEDDN